MRIALTADPELPVPPKHYGGIERIVDLIARELSCRGHDVTLFSNAESTCPVDRRGWRGRTSTGVFDTVKNSVTLTGAVIAGGYDVVHSFSRIAYMGPLLPLRIPKVMSYQREISPQTTDLANTLGRGSVEFTAISHAMIERVPLRGKWHMVPNAVSLQTYEFNADVGPDAPLVFLGRIEQIKGPHIAIQVARRSDRSLVIAGNVPPSHRAWFEREIAPHIDGKTIRYVGAVDDTEKNALLKSAAALLMPILWEEPFGIVMIEAMACGTPVVGFRRGAVPEVVQDGVTGFVVDDVEQLAQSVQKLPEVRREACRSRVEQHYSPRPVVDQYLSVYADAIESARGHSAR